MPTQVPVVTTRHVDSTTVDLSRLSPHAAKVNVYLALNVDQPHTAAATAASTATATATTATTALGHGLRARAAFASARGSFRPHASLLVVRHPAFLLQRAAERAAQRAAQVAARQVGGRGAVPPCAQHHKPQTCSNQVVFKR